jgi:hypothetical protein
MADDHDTHFHNAFGGMPDGSSVRSPFDKIADAMGEVLNKRSATQPAQNIPPKSATDRRSDPAFAAKVRAAQAAQAKRGG